MVELELGSLVMLGGKIYLVGPRPHISDLKKWRRRLRLESLRLDLGKEEMA